MQTIALRRQHERSVALVASNRSASTDVALAVSADVPRTSALLAPTMLLTGHKAAVHCVKFNPSGEVLASASFDKSILLWNVYGECKSFHQFLEHKNAILDLQWSADGGFLVSGAADNTVCVFDAEELVRVMRWREHQGVVNAVATTRRGQLLVASGADDGAVKLWDPRLRHSTQTLELQYQVTALAMTADGMRIFAGSLDNKIHVFDLRRGEEEFALEGHLDTVTGLSLASDDTKLLSNAMDNSMRVWDVQPFATQRHLKTFVGLQHSFEKGLLKCAWSSDGKLVSGGSADRYVYVWDAATGEIRFKLPGHTGSVNEVSFHPKEPIIVSGSSDNSVFLGELASM